MPRINSIKDFVDLLYFLLIYILPKLLYIIISMELIRGINLKILI